MGSDTEGKKTPMGLAALDGYFDNLAPAETNKKALLEELVTNLITLTTSKADMADTIKKIMGEDRQLQQQLNSLKNMPQE